MQGPHRDCGGVRPALSVQRGLVVSNQRRRWPICLTGLPSKLPAGSILGVNYSGCHDSAIALVSPEGHPIFAVALERLTRVKQDGRPLDDVFASLPWQQIERVAVSAPSKLNIDNDFVSTLLTNHLPHPRATAGLAHGPGFHKAIGELPRETVHVGHQDAHAAAAFWASGFDECLCLTYDGGMFNDIWFGGLFKCDRVNGIRPLDRFSTLRHAKITTLYSFVTALLGFIPVRHEGKVTGLAAYGKPTARCRALLSRWFEEEYFEIEKTLRWVNLYDELETPELRPQPEKLVPFSTCVKGIEPEELAASLQAFTEDHVRAILARARTNGLHWPKICLSGGLFSNVKLNSAVSESGFEEVFIAPAMTDDGTALGAAWTVASQGPAFDVRPLQTVFLGPKYSQKDVLSEVNAANLVYSVPANPPKAIAELLAHGFQVAIFQGAGEFGPRALGNRSILVGATDPSVNRTLNGQLRRTDFMPFGPMTRMEDAAQCYVDIEKVRRAAEFMTVAVKCTDHLKTTCPAVVHVDGKARPQLVGAARHPFIHAILTEYRNLTGLLAIINTSFNGHEEPIVSSVRDAIRCFLCHGIDYLYFGCGILISFADNQQLHSPHTALSTA